MNFLLILIALLISGIAVLAVVALGGERAVPGAAFFSGVGRDGLGTFDRVEDLGFLATLMDASEDEKAPENAPSAEVSSAASTAESADTSIDFDGDAYNVHFMYLVAAEGADQKQIVDKANELTMENLNMTVDMIPMTFGAYSTTIANMLAANEPLDMFPAFSSSFPTYIDSGYMVNLNDYEAYLTGVKEQMGDAYYAGVVGDFLCGFTEMKEWGYPDGIICRKDVLDELGINADDIKIDPDDYSSYQQLDDLFAKVKEAKPGMMYKYKIYGRLGS